MPAIEQQRGRSEKMADKTQLHIFVERSDKAIWEAAAATKGQTLSDWIRATLDRAAACDLRTHEKGQAR